MVSPNIEKLRSRNRAVRNGSFKYEDAAWMRDAYHARGLSLRQIADEARCSQRTIARWMEIHGIPTDPTRKPEQRKGADNPRWKGGPPACPKCGGVKSLSASVCISCHNIVGGNNPHWITGDISYPVVHGRVKAARGPASTHRCIECGGQAAHWAYDHSDPNELWGPDKTGCKNRPFSTDISHYQPMCVKCHKRFDIHRTDDLGAAS